MIPTPSDIWFFATDLFTHSFGKAYGSKQHVINVIPVFGAAARFVTWDGSTNTMNVAYNVTTLEDIGQYPMSLTLYDQTQEEYATLMGIKSSEPSQTIYNFTLWIYQRPVYGSKTTTPPDVRMESVFVAYQNNVIDVRQFDINQILNSSDTSLVLNPSDSNNTRVDMNKKGETNSTVPELPRIVMNQNGVIQTNAGRVQDDSPPEPFVESLSSSGLLVVGFTQPMKVPSSL
jgi:hypothetical protein